MKYLFPFLLFLTSMPAQAQTVAGSWQGQFVFNQIVYPSQLEMKINSQKVTGQLTLSMNGQTEISTIEGTTIDGNKGQSAYGNVTDIHNNSSTFSCLLKGGKLSFSIAVGGSFILGELTRVASAYSEPNTVSTAKANGLKMVDKNAGYSFNVPIGFLNNQESNGTYILRKGQEPTTISVFSVLTYNVNRVIFELNQPISINGAVSTLYKTPQLIGNSIVSACHVLYTQGRSVYYYFVNVTSTFESGVTILLVTEGNPPTQSWIAAAISVAKSVSFSKAEKSTLAKQVEQTLRGRGLRHLKVTNYRTEDWQYVFCNDGTYIYNNGGQSRSPGETTLIIRGNNNYNTGTWQVTTHGNMAFLILTSQGGTPVEWPIEFAGGGDVYLNKVIYGLTDNQNCR